MEPAGHPDAASPSAARRTPRRAAEPLVGGAGDQGPDARPARGGRGHRVRPGPGVHPQADRRGRGRPGRRDLRRARRHRRRQRRETPAGRVHPGRPEPGGDRPDSPLARGPRPARPADRRLPPAAPGRHLGTSGIVGVPRRAPADAQLPRRPGTGPRRGVRQPVPDRQTRRRRVHRGRRGRPGRPGRRGRRGGGERPAVRRGPPPAALDPGQCRGHHPAAVRRPVRRGTRRHHPAGARALRR